MGRNFAHIIDKKIKVGSFFLIDVMPFFSCLMIFVKGVILFYILLTTGLFILARIKLYPWLLITLENAYAYLPWLGLGIVFSTFWVKPEKNALLGR